MIQSSLVLNGIFWGFIFIKCGPHLFGVGRELIIPGALKSCYDDNFNS